MGQRISLRRTGAGGDGRTCTRITLRKIGSNLLAATVVALGLSPLNVRAIEELSFQAGPAAGHAWSVAQVRTRLLFHPAGGLSFNLDATGVRLPAPLDTVRALRVACDDAAITPQGFDCRGGIVEVTNAPGLPVLEPASFELEYGQDRFRLKIDGLRMGEGEIRVAASGSGKHWSLMAEGRQLPLAVIAALAGDRMPASNLTLTSGTVSGAIRWASKPARGNMSANMRVGGLGFSDIAGLNVGENLSLDLEIEASRSDGPWRYVVAAGLSGGQVYFHPLFVDAGNGALRLKAEGDVDVPSGVLEVHRFQGSHDDVVTVNGRARLMAANNRLEPVEIHADARVAAIRNFHDVYLEPWLAGSALAGAELGGSLDAALSWRAAGPSSARLRLRDVSIDDAQARYGAIGVNGALKWSTGTRTDPSALAWKGAHFYRIDIGGGELQGRFEGERFELLEPVLFPMLGGVLAVNAFDAEGLGTADPGWQFSGRLTPISLAELTNRLAWPSFSGQVSGVIPSVRYSGGDITVDGTLAMQAFDGSVRISDLKLSRLFGVVPRVTANIRLADLSLDALTRTFSFGNIQGRLDGRIDNLVLENWRPAEFDAEFVTPEEDTSRHRISQRAVENLASLGGAGRILSSTALRFLESFSYDRLGIRCRLRNGVCEMDGIEPAERGYYIVKGGGLPPRIDVLGFNNRVDWNKLVQRLKAARVDQAVIR